MHIREETPADQGAIQALVTAAFARRDEADLVDALRTDGDLSLSLVAEEGKDLVGHVALSRLKSPEGALALAPVSVQPSHQDRGIGAALIREAIARTRESQASIIFVVGEPGYYTRFGFTAEAAAPYPCDYAGPHFMALALDDPPTPAAVVYPDAFSSLS